MSWFTKKIHQKGKSLSSFGFKVLPEEDFFVVGDIHGRVDIVKSLLEKIQSTVAKPKIIFVGDYIDRGDQSAQVLRGLARLTEHAPDRLICLMGNHEEMLLQFLDNPRRYGKRWMRYGGLQTLASYGIAGSSGHNMTEVRDALVDAMGKKQVAWLRNLPRRWSSGNVHVVHAGADPKVPMALQSDEALTWGHPKFESVTRSDGIWIVHGHTIVDEPRSEQGRISVDTGAYATGRLTAAHITPGHVSFISTYANSTYANSTA